MRLKREAMQVSRSNHARAGAGLSVGFVLAPVLVLVLLLGGCSAEISKPDAPRPQAYGCLDDSPQCIQSRQAALQQLQADKSRTWVRQPATMNSYATGVRLFAFKTEKQRLSCDELAIGRREADAAPGVLRSGEAQSIQPFVRNRSLMLAGEVSKELTREAQRRSCRA
jgi:hypothetical protein